MAALLHDVLDDTDVEYAEVEEQFGSEVRCRRCTQLLPCFTFCVDEVVARRCTQSCPASLLVDGVGARRSIRLLPCCTLC